MPLSMETEKSFKRGEIIMRENDTPDALYVIKSGRVALFLDRNGRRLEIDQLGPNMILGETVLMPQPKLNYSVMALADTRILILPLELVKMQVEKSLPTIKMLNKSVLEQIRQLRNLIRSIKLEREEMAVPQLSIAKIFGILNLVARHAGQRKGDSFIELSWQALKIYTTRFFLESPQRIEGLLQLCQKLGYLQLVEAKNDDGEMELDRIEIKDIETIEQFGEFYQYHLYKGGRSESIYVDPLALQVAMALLRCSDGATLDHQKAVRLEYEALLKRLRSEFRLDLKATHLQLLEKKGLYALRKSTDDGVYLSFDPQEFKSMVEYWRILSEIQRWNELGHVDLSTPDTQKNDESDQECPGCHQKLEVVANFCPHCGAQVGRVRSSM